MILQASQLVGSYLEFHTLNHILDCTDLNQIPTYLHTPPISWDVYLSPQAVSLAYKHGNRCFPNRAHLGLLALLLYLDWYGTKQGIILDYLSEHGVSRELVSTALAYAHKHRFPQRVRYGRQIGMKYKRQALLKLKR